MSSHFFLITLMTKKISWKFRTVFGCLKAFSLASVEAVEATLTKDHTMAGNAKFCP